MNRLDDLIAPFSFCKYCDFRAYLMALNNKQQLAKWKKCLCKMEMKPIETLHWGKKREEKISSPCIFPAHEYPLFSRQGAYPKCWVQISAALSNQGQELIVSISMGLRGFKAVWPWAHSSGLCKSALAFEMILGAFLGILFWVQKLRL